MMLSEAKKFIAMRVSVCNWQNRRLSRTIKKTLIEFSHIWMDAALKEERHVYWTNAAQVEVQEAETSQLIAQGLHEADDVSNAI